MTLTDNPQNGNRARNNTMRVEIDDDTVRPEPSDEFVQSQSIQEVAKNALAYLEVGYPVHFSGPAGTGKTTLAFHVASQRGRPVTLIHGDHEFGSSDLVGRDNGYRKHKLVDNFIHSVLKTEEEMSSLWVDNRLTTACINGHTLIYDEFNRSKPEANNALLSVLSEKILNLPSLRRAGQGYLKVHSDFRILFTSNPEEYAGVHKTQDALMDRVITIQLDHYDRETEVEIIQSKSGLSATDTKILVDIIRQLRRTNVDHSHPTIRAGIAIARVLKHLNARPRLNDPVFHRVCGDVLGANTAKVTHQGEAVRPSKVNEAITQICETPRSRKSAKTTVNPRR